MSDSLEHQIDLVLDTRRQSDRQCNAEQDLIETTITDAHAELERQQVRFCTVVRALLGQAVERANRHMAKRAEGCQLCEISGWFTGPLYAGGSVCNPIGYELRANGRAAGEALVLELTHDGMIVGSLGPFHATVSEGHTDCADIGWHSVPLSAFDATTAADIVVRYMTAVTARWSLDGCVPGPG